MNNSSNSWLRVQSHNASRLGLDDLSRISFFSKLNRINMLFGLGDSGSDLREGVESWPV